MNRTVRNVLAALLLGAGGFAANTLELQLGWGLHFIFGNALVYAFVRVLPRGALVTAASLSSAWTIVLWNHPWAWALWTLEAAVVALLVERTSPIKTDLGFWLLLGTPLLILSYGTVMGMDVLSLSLAIVKQALNGILNVALGELLYAVGLMFIVRAKSVSLTRLPIDAFVLMLMVVTILIPTFLYLSFDAQSREQTARADVGRRLDSELRLAAQSLALWQDARAQALRTYAQQYSVLPGGLAQPPAELAADFRDITIQSTRDVQARPVPASDTAGQDAGRLQIVTLPNGQNSPRPRLALVLPLLEDSGKTVLLAPLRQATLQQRIARLDLKDASIFLMSPTGERIVLQPLGRAETDDVTFTRQDLAKAQVQPVLLSRASYGSALMSDLKNAAILGTIPLPNQPGWRIVGISRLDQTVLHERKAQLDLFLTLAALVVLVIFAGSLLAKRLKRSLRRLAQTAADLAMSGANRTTIDHLVIRELSELSINLATVGSAVAEERGALISYQRRLSSIARNAPVVVYTLNAVSRAHAPLDYVSDAIKGLLGYSQAEAVRPSWWRTAVHPDDYRDCRDAFDALRPGHSISHEYRLRHKQGHYVWVYDTLALEADPVNGHPEAIGLMLDITDRRRAAEQLIQADKMASLGRMVAGVAHELNQPLNFIKLAASNLRERSKRGQFDSDRFAAKFDTIIASTERAAAIILQMRVFGRTPTETAGPMRVKSACDELGTLLSAQLDAEGIALDTAGCDPDLELYALPMLVEQVLLNLLLNARDAILSTSPLNLPSAGLITVSAKARGERAVITVEDNGPGIPEHVMPALFEPFFTTKPPREGTGLGLSISYGIIRDLGGTLEAANTSRGAMFTINLPRCT